ncbi:2-C-methyl-D-erythritol 2,4-cyclodiphosphate synthase [Bowdeniella nasicola]|uniref:2-C-methyl-D-erythritol 2,4-cyclodiphosphate synthase n=1 Tax=Bowdeniella nasicola TaxID=208480 RepID=A0A1Q5Q0D9_9ACTO|nr:2-C-methyl-D-erythritol 2,4-cyclodiphosphate synthase [Bowdeniella nasicola]OKL53353.1 2-C-methyl-D-erythritol 2,4-cyclodiphosphate synthase [Bowdeniella nasicola]
MSQPIIPRVGIATDVHAFDTDPDRPLMLACLHWPGEIGLVGHSDADVAAHVACDALFSAAGIGDLGTHFGTGRPEYDGASGTRLLEESVRLVTDAGYEIGNIAIQIIGQKPKFTPRAAEACRVMSDIVGAPVAVSATTTDHLGFTGRNEGLAAVATALVYPR